MENVFQYLLDNAKFLGIVTSAVGAAKTASDILRSRSHASLRDMSRLSRLFFFSAR